MKFDISVRIICMEKNRIVTERKNYRFVFFYLLRILRQLLQKRANMDFSPNKRNITALKPSLANTGSQSGQLQPINSFYQCLFFQTHSKDSRRGINLLDF